MLWSLGEQAVATEGWFKVSSPYHLLKCSLLDRSCTLSYLDLDKRSVIAYYLKINNVPCSIFSLVSSFLPGSIERYSNNQDSIFVSVYSYLYLAFEDGRYRFLQYNLTLNSTAFEKSFLAFMLRILLN